VTTLTVPKKEFTILIENLAMLQFDKLASNMIPFVCASGLQNICEKTQIENIYLKNGENTFQLHVPNNKQMFASKQVLVSHQRRNAPNPKI
jgi:hypothetical protein